MNFPTHVMFGMLIGALFFGKMEIILLVGIGSAIPDMDREYGFFSKDESTNFIARCATTLSSLGSSI